MGPVMPDQGESVWMSYNVPEAFEWPEDVTDYFDLTAQPDSKIWRLIRSRDEFTAPMLLKRLEGPFMVAEVTIRATLEEHWDQAGLVLFMDMSPDEPWVSPQSIEGRRQHPPMMPTGKWATVSLQMSDNELGVGTVMASPGCGPDFTFSHVPLDASSQPHFPDRTAIVRVKFQKSNDMLLVSYMIPDTYRLDLRSAPEISMQWRTIREIAGFFVSDTAKPSVLVGCYASRPSEADEDTTSDFVADFEALEIFEDPRGVS